MKPSHCFKYCLLSFIYCHGRLQVALFEITFFILIPCISRNQNRRMYKNNGSLNLVGNLFIGVQIGNLDDLGYYDLDSDPKKVY